jgi:hypothetical protein
MAARFIFSSHSNLDLILAWLAVSTAFAAAQFFLQAHFLNGGSERLACRMPASWRNACRTGRSVRPTEREGPDIIGDGHNNIRQVDSLEKPTPDAK